MSSDPEIWQSDLDPAWRRVRLIALSVIAVLAALVIAGLWLAIFWVHA